MLKRKEFSILWLVIGLLLCLVPLLIYLIIYASESDKMVQIYLADPATGPAVVQPPAGQLSPDGRWRWDGLQWVPVPALPPSVTAPRQADTAGTPPGPTERYPPYAYSSPLVRTPPSHPFPFPASFS